MKKNRIGLARRAGRFFFNVPAWMGFKNIQEHGTVIAQQTKLLFTQPDWSKKPAPEEIRTFEQAMAEYGLEETDLQRLQSRMWQSCILYMGIGVALWGYAGLMGWQAHWESSILTVCISLVPWGYAFRMHFLYTQIKVRRLGLTWQDWLQFWKNHDRIARGKDV